MMRMRIQRSLLHIGALQCSVCSWDSHRPRIVIVGCRGLCYFPAFPGRALGCVQGSRTEVENVCCPGDGQHYPDLWLHVLLILGVKVVEDKQLHNNCYVRCVPCEICLEEVGWRQCGLKLIWSLLLRISEEKVDEINTGFMRQDSLRQ